MGWLVDSRKGSGELASRLSVLVPGTETVPKMECADFAMVDGDGSLVGVERKTVGDLLRVISDGRFVSEQLPCLLNTYTRAYLLVEGDWKPDPDSGLLLRRKGANYETPDWGRRGGWTYAEVVRWIVSIEDSGIRYHRTRSEYETLRWLTEMHAELSKPSAKRRALQQIHSPEFPGLVAPSGTRRFAHILPGVGTDKSAKVADFFGSIYNAAVATPKQWMEVEGIGKTSAQRIHDFIRGK